MAAVLACLHSAEASLVLECKKAGPPLWRHLGALVDPAGLAALAEQRTAASFSLDEDVPFSTAPPAGLGWFGPPAVSLLRDGRQQLATFGAAQAVTGGREIAIRLVDPVAGVELHQNIAVEPGGAFRFSASLRNIGDRAVTLNWLASALIPLPGLSAGLVSWRGRHNAELVERLEPMPQQGWVRETRRGISGHGGPPGLVVLTDGATQHAGLAVSVQLAWSGDTRITVERDDEGRFMLSAGAVLLPGEIVLQPGDSFTAPDAVVAVSVHGRNGVLAQQQAAVRTRLRGAAGKMKPRPVHLNSWEACYFDHDDQRMGDLAIAAAAIGVERFVLDDGWFRGRDDDTAGLGDWTADHCKYPQGLRPLADRVTALGMEFGLWVEPEMVNPDSDLYRANPDWVLAVADRARPLARNQLVLDMARPQVRDYLFGALDQLLTELPISYLKWDHNRDLAPAGGAAQVRGTYDLLERLRTAHPAVEIESCAGGGGRSDAGIAEFVQRFWTSDNIDAVSRIPMQRGFLNFLPAEMMGAHVGASPAHATGRSQSLAFRAAIAMPGHFGVELDPRQLTASDQAQLAEWIAFYKQWRYLMHGTQTWLGEGADGLVWQAAGSSAEFLLFVIRTAEPLDRRPQPLPLPFLDNVGQCQVTLLRTAGGLTSHAAASAPLFDRMRAEPQFFTASWLAQAGLPLPPLNAESVAIFHLMTRA